MTRKTDLPIIHFTSKSDWESWLEQNHGTSAGIWMKLAKKDSGIESITYQEALDIALCHGWIDGQKGAFDENFWLQRFTRRGPKSKWSKINREKAIGLIAGGRMKDPGLAEVEAAQRDGRWEAAYEPQSSMSVPDDLRKMLDENPAARDFFATLNSTNRYAILYRIHDAKKPETRARRIEKYVAMLSEGKTIY